MHRHENCSSANVLTRKSAQQFNNRASVASFKHKNPITTSEKLNVLEKKFETVTQSSKGQFDDSKKEITEIKAENVELRGQLGTVVAEIQSFKDQLVDSKKEAAESKLENVALRAQFGTVVAEIQSFKDQLVDSKKEIAESKAENVALHAQFGTVVAEIQSFKDQLVDSKKEVAESKAENVALRAQFGIVIAEIQSFKDQLVDSKKEIAESKAENVALRAQFGIVIAEFQSSKEQLVDSKKDIAVVKKENVKLRAQLADLKEKINLKGDNSGQDVARAATVNVNFPRKIFQKLPCTDEPELVLFTDNLRDLATVTYLENRLGSIGGVDVKSCIKSILDRLMSKELLAALTLTGKRTEKGGLLSYVAITDLIHNSVRRSFKNYKDKEGELIIGKYLQKYN